MVRDEWARPRYEHRDVRAEYSWRGFRGRSRGWKRRGRWRPRFDRRRWDDDRSHDEPREYDEYGDHPMDNDQESSRELDMKVEEPNNTPQEATKEAEPSVPQVRVEEPIPEPVPEPVPAQKAPEIVNEAESIPTEPALDVKPEEFDSDATDEDVTAATAKALKIELPPTKIESALMELYSQLPKQKFKYFSADAAPDYHPKPAHPSAAVVAIIKQRQREVQDEIENARSKYKKIREEWNSFCSTIKTTAPTPPNPKKPRKPEVPESPRQLGGRRNRSHGDAVRSEAEFMEILANLEMETARDPLIRAQLTSVQAPPQIFDPVELKALYIDTNNLVTDKGVLKKRLEFDNVDTFTEQEHQRFCDAYVQFPKQFGKIAAIMGGFRSFHECVMHYYRTKKECDYKQLIQKRKPKGRRGRKPKKPRIEDVVSEKPDDSMEDVVMSVEEAGPGTSTEGVDAAAAATVPEVPASAAVEPVKVAEHALKLEPSPLDPSPLAEKEAPAELVPAPESAPVADKQLELPPPNLDQSMEPEALPPVTQVLGEASSTATTELVQNAAMAAVATEEAERVVPVVTAATESEPPAPAQASLLSAKPEPQVPEIKDARDPDATVDEPLKKIPPMNETPIKPRETFTFASSTPLMPKPLPVRTPQNIPKPSSIPPPVQPLSGNKLADPMPSNGIDALATLALETEKKEIDEKVKGRKPRRRKDATKPTSYWNAAETKKFETLLNLFGTKWEEIAKHIHTKSAIMLKNHYTKYKSIKGYEEIVEKADARNAQSGVLPMYVSADVDEDEDAEGNGGGSSITPPITASATTAGQSGFGGSTNTPANAPANTSPSPTPVPASTETLPRIANGPPSGFFEPRQRQVPVQSFHPETEKKETFVVGEQPPRPFVRPRTSMLASILHEGAELPRPKTNFMEADSYKMDSGLPFLGGAPYRESNERGHN